MTAPAASKTQDLNAPLPEVLYNQQSRGLFRIEDKRHHYVTHKHASSEEFIDQLKEASVQCLRQIIIQASADLMKFEADLLNPNNGFQANLLREAIAEDQLIVEVAKKALFAKLHMS